MIRFYDIVFSLLALFILFPLFLVIICILKFTGEGEVFYMQDRVGKSGTLFKLFKFSTMLKDSPNLGTGTVTVKNDVRILPVGKFLRKTKINELPQLFNVLLGEMSLIGPRPLTPETFSAYSKNIQDTIILVRPGLSGIGSIVFRGEEDIMSEDNASIEFYKNVIAPYKGDLEEWYVINRSFYVYVTSIFLTIWVIFLPKSKAPWLFFKELPKLPLQLQKLHDINS